MSTDKDKVIRKLRAILSADVKGYSLLMADDESSTIKRLESYRGSMSDLIRSHSGRVVDAVGDNLLAEFSSVVDAVRCSVEIQKDLKQKNADLPADKRLEFRIGVNIGDVVQEGDRLYGNGVNVAARIEGLAESGGICISRNSYSHVRDKLELGYEYLGEHSVKNIKRPVRVYKVLMNPEDAGKLIGDVPKPVTKKWVWATAVLAAIVITAAVSLVYQNVSKPEFEPAKVEDMEVPLPEKPSIAVLPLENMSDDPMKEYLGDGITEHIITSLSKLPRLFVISRTSTFSYKGKPVKVQQVAEDLGVQYVLEGSFQLSGDKIRITVQLIDALTGRHRWSESYDRDLKDIFALQDEITLKVVKAMRVELNTGEQASFSKIGTENLKAYLKFLEGHGSYLLLTNESNIRAKQLLEEAIALDPEFSIAYSYLGACHIDDLFWGWSKSDEKSMMLAYEFAQKSLSLDDSLPESHIILSRVNLLQKKYEEAIAEAQHAVKINPNHVWANFFLGWILRCAGKPEEAIPFMKKTIRLMPIAPEYVIETLGRAYFLTGQYEEAIASYRKVVDVNPDWRDAHIGLAATYAVIGREEEARSEVSEILRIEPSFSIKKYKSIMFLQVGLEPEIEGLRKAGLPEYPPGKEPPEKPSIAVLPFDNLSDDPEQGYLADGLTDELIGDLAKIDGIFVISRNSTFTYKGKDIKIPEVAKELNVRYVLEGSVQRAGNRLRIRAQLIDGETDHHVWAESYDGDGTMDNIFELQDEITGKIVAALAVKLTESEKERISDKGTDNIEAYDTYLKGHALYAKFTPESVLKSLDYYKQAIEIDPKFSRAYAGLALSCWILSTDRFALPLGLDHFTYKFKARHFLKIALKNPTWEAYRVLAFLELDLRHFDNALTSAEKAFSMAPNEDLTNIALGFVLLSVGRPEEGIYYLKQAIALAPQLLDIKLDRIGNAYFLMGNYKEAISYIEQAISISPEISIYNIILAASYALSGRKNEAIKALQIYRDKELGKPLSSEWLYYVYIYKDHEVFERLLTGLKIAGFEEDPLEYVKVEKENRLSGDEIENLAKGKKLISKWGAALYCYKDGRLEIHPFGVGGPAFNGKWWVENNMGCMQSNNLYDGIEICSDWYRTIASENNKYDYFYIDDSWITPFIIQEIE